MKSAYPVCPYACHEKIFSWSFLAAPHRILLYLLQTWSGHVCELSYCTSSSAFPPLRWKTPFHSALPCEKRQDPSSSSQVVLDFPSLVRKHLKEQHPALGAAPQWKPWHSRSLLRSTGECLTHGHCSHLSPSTWDLPLGLQPDAADLRMAFNLPNRLCYRDKQMHSLACWNCCSLGGSDKLAAVDL